MPNILRGGTVILPFPKQGHLVLRVPELVIMGCNMNAGTLLAGAKVFFVCLFVLFFCLFRAAPAASGSSQTSGLIGAVAAGLHHSSQQRWILNPLSKARDRTCSLMVPSRIRFCCATMGTPTFFLFKITIIIIISRAAPAAYGSSQARVESELQLLAHPTATAVLDP